MTEHRLDTPVMSHNGNEAEDSNIFHHIFFSSKAIFS